MPRDYKHRKRGRAVPSSTALSPFVAGLAAGLAVAVLVHLYHAGRDAPPGERQAASPVPATVEEPAEPQAPEAEYTFYDLLPKYEVVVPETPQGAAPDRQPAAIPAGTYILQAGSFRRFEDADRQKAKLALLGISSQIKKVTIDDEYTTHRVQIGPVSDPRELASLRARLAEAGIAYLPLKARDSG